MMRGLFQLTWLEIKIFLREPLGALGTLLMPVAIYLILGRVMGGRSLRAPQTAETAAFLAAGATIMSGGATLVAIIGAAMSGGGAAALMEAVGHGVDQRRAELLQKQIERGGILLWVSLRKLGAEEKARRILESCGASEVQIHTVGDRAPDPISDAR